MAMALEQAYAYCQRITRAEARNFYYAFITLPRPRRQAIYATYAFCRLCDDIADEPATPEAKALFLKEVRQRLEAAFQGRPNGPVFSALAHAAATFAIPQEYFLEVIRGVEMDLTQHRYRTFEELQGYCYRVASVVGLICLQVFGYRDPRARDYAVALGLAMQLTNILRDLKEDAERGRIYLPLEELERFGYPEEALLQGVVNDAFRDLMRFQVARARAYFQQGKQLIPLLPLRSRACPTVLGGIYVRLLDRIEASGYNVFSKRVRLSSWEKLLLTLRLWCQSMVPLTPVATAW